MNKPTEAVLVVHGASVRKKDETRAALVDCLCKVLQGRDINIVGEVTVAGAHGLRLEFAGESPKRTMDVYECYWGDLIPSLSQQPLRRRVTRGLSMLIFWTVSPVWRVVRRNKYMIFGTVGSLLLLLMWYYGVLAMFLTAFTLSTEVTVRSPQLESLVQNLRSAGTSMNGWELWAAATLLMGLLPVNQVVDLSSFVQQFLVGSSSERVGVRDEVYARSRKALDAIVRSTQYSNVTVVAHSFGALVAVDALADSSPLGSTRVRLITLGSALELLSTRSPWVDEEIRRIVDHDGVDEWIDLYSEQDPFASAVPQIRNSAKCRSVRVDLAPSLSARISGKVHNNYWKNLQVLREVTSNTELVIAGAGE